MKKLMFVAVAALSTSLIAADAGMASANIVGYTTVPVSRLKYTPLAVQFKGVGAATTTLAITNLLTVSTPKGWSTLHGRADQIHVWTGNAWQKYYFSSAVSPNAWVKDGDSVATGDTVKNGDTVFFLRSSAGANSGDTITLPGEVNVIQPTVSVGVKKLKYYFICHPWPTEFPVDGFRSALGAKAKAWTSLHARADQVHRWTGMAWQKYYNSSTLGGYVKDGEDVLTTDKIGVGEGVFFLRSSAGASDETTDYITFTKPDNL